MKTLEIILLILILLLTAAWILGGYLGWTWIPIGKPAGKDQIRVACIGDSITYGAMILNWYRYNMPHRLQKLLGRDYCVHNYGMSARTAMDTGDHPYRKEIRFRRSLRYKPDIVFLMFGTNDSKTDNWRGRDEFKSQYLQLVQNYRDLPGNPVLYLMQPPAPHHMHGEQGDIYTFNIQRSKIIEIGAIVREVAAETGCRTIDMFAITEGYPQWFVTDGIHPNAEGAEQIAELWAGIIKEAKTSKTL